MRAQPVERGQGLRTEIALRAGALAMDDDAVAARHHHRRRGAGAVAARDQEIPVERQRRDLLLRHDVEVVAEAGMAQLQQALRADVAGKAQMFGHQRVELGRCGDEAAVVRPGRDDQHRLGCSGEAGEFDQHLAPQLGHRRRLVDPVDQRRALRRENGGRFDRSRADDGGKGARMKRHESGENNETSAARSRDVGAFESRRISYPAGGDRIFFAFLPRKSGSHLSTSRLRQPFREARPRKRVAMSPFYGCVSSEVEFSFRKSGLADCGIK
ncbi:hypothetical protein CHKEEEPN_4285 [Methylorubrum podarium]|nr:hypothetical protein CHKEEEPN_4285 [Methylorubrum podarium]